MKFIYTFNLLARLFIKKFDKADSWGLGTNCIFRYDPETRP